MKGSAILPLLLAAAVPLFIIGLLLLTPFAGLLQWRPPTLWTNQFGTPGMENGVLAVGSTSNGIYAVGYLNTSLLTGNGMPVLTKYNADGTKIWTQAPLQTELLLSGVATASDGVYAVGGSDPNITLFKYDASGNLLWMRSIHAGGAFGFSGEITPASNGVYLAGFSGQFLENQTYATILFLREYYANGTVAWTKETSVNSTSVAEVWGVYAGRSVYVLTPDFLVDYASDGTMLWSMKTGALPFIEQDSLSGDGTNAYISGSARSSTLATPSGFLTKYDATGRVIWIATFDSPDQSGVGLTFTWSDSSGLYVSFASGEGNGYVAKYDFTGHQQWIFETPNAPPLGITPRSTLVGSATNGGFLLAGAVRQNSSRATWGYVQDYSRDSSLILFGVNPPLSFFILGGLIAAASGGFLAYTRLRKTGRPGRIGPKPGNIPVSD